MKKICASLPSNIYELLKQDASQVSCSISSRVVLALRDFYIEKGYSKEWLLQGGNRKRSPNKVGE